MPLDPHPEARFFPPPLFAETLTAERSTVASCCSSVDGDDWHPAQFDLPPSVRSPASTGSVLTECVGELDIDEDSDGGKRNE